MGTEFALEISGTIDRLAEQPVEFLFVFPRFGGLFRKL